MARTAMTEEHKSALLEAKARTIEQNRERRGKRINVPPWSVYRSDEHNICLQKNDDEPLYYPDVASAFRGLFRRLIEPTRKMDLAAHRQVVADAEARIVKALEASRNLFDG